MILKGTNVEFCWLRIIFRLVDPRAELVRSNNEFNHRAPYLFSESAQIFPRIVDFWDVQKNHPRAGSSASLYNFYFTHTVQKRKFFSHFSLLHQFDYCLPETIGHENWIRKKKSIDKIFFFFSLFLLLNRTNTNNKNNKHNSVRVSLILWLSSCYFL